MAMELPSEMVEQILSWVPSRSLSQLRSICKQWKALIEEPRFSMKHLSHMRGREQQFTLFSNYLCLGLSGSTVYGVGMGFDKDPALNSHVLQPILIPYLVVVEKMCHCDGLLLLVMGCKLLVFNPLLKHARWIKCRYSLGKRKDAFGDGYGLGYIAEKSSLRSRFRYRIVRFGYGDCGVGKSSIEVYDFDSDSWSVVVDKTFSGFSESPKSSVCLRGTPYWLGYLNGKSFATIQSFSFSEERFESLFLPPSCISSDRWIKYLSLGVFRGDKLSLLHKPRDTSTIHLWVMKKHWSRLMTVDLPEFPLCPRNSGYFTDDNNGKLVVVTSHGSGSMTMDIVGENQESQKVEYCSSVDHASGGSSACYYVPSLLPVPGGVVMVRMVCAYGFQQKQ